MKRAFTLFLIVLMVLICSAGHALPLIGSHPCEGDKGGVRAKIISKSISPGGVVIDPAALAGLGVAFTAAGSNTNSGSGGYKLLSLLSKESGDGVGASKERCTCNDPCGCITTYFCLEHIADPTQCDDDCDGRIATTFPCEKHMGEPKSCPLHP